MGKIRVLKSSYWKHKLSLCIYKKYIKKAHFSVKCEKKNILIFCGAGLGDTIVLLTFVDNVLKNYKKGEVILAVEDKWYKHYRSILGSDVKMLVYTFSNQFTKKIQINTKFFKAVNHFEIDSCFMFSRYQEFHRYMRCNRIFVGSESQTVFDERATYLNESAGVIELLKEAYSYIYTQLEFLNDASTFHYQWEKNHPQYQNDIIFAIGASEKNRIFSVEKSAEILAYLVERFPDKKVLLIGNGSKQVEYTKKLLLQFSHSSVVNLVGKLSILEMLDTINSVSLFVGFDSGPYNASAIFGKKTIGFFEHVSGFEHNQLENVSIIMKSEQSIFQREFEYGSERLNSISIRDLEDAIETLGVC